MRSKRIKSWITSVTSVLDLANPDSKDTSDSVKEENKACGRQIKIKLNILKDKQEFIFTLRKIIWF